MQTETLWQKWCKHYRNGGVWYALFRGVKFLIYLFRKYILRK